MKEILYSIIIPHKDILKLLKRCINSIPIRNDTEIIIVDDNSSKDVQVELGAFIKDMARNDIKLISLNKSGGGGYARNAGLKKATGKWVLFSDADDFFNYCIRDIFDDYKYNESDIVFFNANSLDSELYTESRRAKYLNQYIKMYEKNPEQAELLLRYKFGEPWCKLVKRKVIIENEIRFEETSIHNDTAYSYFVGYYAKNVSVDKRALYCVTTREGSVSISLSESKKLERIGVFARSSLFFRNHDLPVTENWHFRQLYESWKENKETYRKGLELLCSMGYSNIEIKKGLIIQILIYMKTSVTKILHIKK